MQYFSQGHRLGHRLRSSQLKPELWVLRCSTTPCHLCSDSPGSLPPACIYSTSLPLLVTGPAHPLCQNPGKHRSLLPLRLVTMTTLIASPKQLSDRFLFISPEQNLV